MDIMAHGLWTGALYSVINSKRKAKERIKILPAVLWGIFPDVFAFTIPFAYMLFGLLFGFVKLSQFPNPSSVEPLSPALHAIFSLTSNLYSFSHSLIIFFAVIAIIYFITRKVYWSMGGWLLHILIDIPSHSYSFYPTPIFWPLSGWKFNGISWSNPWFMVINYLALVIVYIWLWRTHKLKRK